jgi:hypothetical protein
MGVGRVRRWLAGPPFLPVQLSWKWIEFCLLPDIPSQVPFEGGQKCVYRNIWGSLLSHVLFTDSFELPQIPDQNKITQQMERRDGRDRNNVLISCFEQPGRGCWNKDRRAF